MESKQHAGSHGMLRPLGNSKQMPPMKRHQPENKRKQKVQDNGDSKFGRRKREALFLPNPEAVCDRTSARSHEETSNMPANSDQLQAEETFEDIKIYFTKDEWAELQDWEKEVYRSLKEHYDIIISFGYYISKPDFMSEIKINHQVSDCVSSRCSWDQPPIQPETNTVSKLIDSTFPIPSNIHPTNHVPVTEKSGGVEQKENTQQCTVQEFQERSAVQSKEHSFYSCSECKEKFNCLETFHRHLEIHNNKQSQRTSYMRERSHSTCVTVYHEEARGGETAEQQNCVESPTRSVLQPIKMGKKRSRCTEDQQLSGQQPSQLVQQSIHIGEKQQKSTASVKIIKRSSTFNKCQQILTAEKLYKCIEYGKSNSQIGHINIHKQTHTVEKPFKCTECGKSFSQLGNLRRHEQIHTGEKLYKCTECEKCFSHIGSLKSHEQIHTGEKPYKCTECGKSFSHVGGLTNHKLLHTGDKPYKCLECGKRFTQSRNLYKHELLHTSEKPHKCTECGKSFRQVGSLKKHKQIHTGEKPHKCTECGKSFTQLGNLYKHKLLHTGEKPHNGTSQIRTARRLSESGLISEVV
nr:PREDICTED: zinc finger protein 93-like [Latimeria chalumnae]|eukprot:XP_014352647.1 PREDICTED: zinc finger protein 93-like [Latimeria chalumnae]